MHGAHNTCQNACILSAKNAHALVHARLRSGAETSLPWKLLQTYLESCASIVQAVVLLLSRRNQSPNAVLSKNPSKSTLAHDAVTTAVSHKHHSIIRVGAGLIQLSMVRTRSVATELTNQCSQEQKSRLPDCNVWKSRVRKTVQHRLNKLLWVQLLPTRDEIADFLLE